MVDNNNLRCGPNFFVGKQRYNAHVNIPTQENNSYKKKGSSKQHIT